MLQHIKSYYLLITRLQKQLQQKQLQQKQLPQQHHQPQLPLQQQQQHLWLQVLNIYQ
jgi:hypothetical protein